MIRVELTWPEVMMAGYVGVMRRVHALRSGRNGVDGATVESAWDHDINGACAELATAKWAGVYWTGTVGVVTAPDVGTWQVRSKLEPDHRLVVKRSDADEQVFISVMVAVPVCTICGWMTAKDAKRDEWLLTPKGRPAMFFVPNKDLRPMDELRRRA